MKLWDHPDCGRFVHIHLATEKVPADFSAGKMSKFHVRHRVLSLMKTTESLTVK